jgi:hypothetical protein
MKAALRLTTVAGILLASRPGVAAESDPAAVALSRDISRIVGSQEGAGWFVDSSALIDIHPILMESVCRATPETRTRTRALLEEQVSEKGDPRKLFQERREVDDAVDDARRAERELQAFDYANARVQAECPYWVDAGPDFRGRQSDADRFTLSLETGGLLQLRQTEGTWSFGGGGYGRILPGYGIGGDVTILAGPEFGGGAMLKPKTSPTEFVINYFPAFPIVTRFHDGGLQYDIEVAGVGLFQANDFSLSYGTRIGGSVGLKALRTRNILPWAGLHVAYEHYFESGGRATAHFIRGGLRVGLMWDP